jgi:hypothetical protein
MVHNPLASPGQIDLELARKPTNVNSEPKTQTVQHNHCQMWQLSVETKYKHTEYCYEIALFPKLPNSKPPTYTPYRHVNIHFKSKLRVCCHLKSTSVAHGAKCAAYAVLFNIALTAANSACFRARSLWLKAANAQKGAKAGGIQAAA